MCVANGGSAVERQSGRFEAFGRYRLLLGQYDCFAGSAPLEALQSLSIDTEAWEGAASPTSWIC